MNIRERIVFNKEVKSKEEHYINEGMSISDAKAKAIDDVERLYDEYKKDNK